MKYLIYEENGIKLCDTAGTLVKAAKQMKEAGAKSVRSIVTHGVLSGPALDRIHNALADNTLDDFVCSDSYSDSSRTLTVCQGEELEMGKFIRFIPTAKQISKGILATESHRSIENLKTVY